MTKKEQNEFVQQALKEQVLSNPAYAATRKKILILMCIPAVLFLIDRIWGILNGALAESGGIGIIWGFFFMAAIIVCAVNGQIVSSAVLLFVSGGMTFFTLVSLLIAYGTYRVGVGLTLFYAVYVIAFIAVGVILLCDKGIKAYRAHYKVVRQGAKAEAASMGAR